MSTLTYAETLIDFCQHLGIKQGAMEEPESQFVYKLNVDLPAGTLKAESVPKLLNLLTLFEDSITIALDSRVLTFSDGSTVIDGNSVSSDSIQRLTEIVDSCLANNLELELSINKSLIIAKLGLNTNRFNCLFYLFERKLTVVFGEPLLRVDKLVFDGSLQKSANEEVDKPTVIVVSDTDLHFAGEMLTIVGEKTLRNDAGLIALLQGNSSSEIGGAALAKSKVAGQSQPSKPSGCLSLLRFPRRRDTNPDSAVEPAGKEESIVLDAALQEQIRKYRTAAEESPSLVGQQFKHLTPLHFAGRWKKKGSRELENALAAHLVNICILYTANRSTFDATQKPVEAVYNSSDRTATLSLKAAPAAEVPSEPLESLAKWLYSGKGAADQRTVFQHIIARELYGEDATASYNNFIARLPRLWKDTVWQYKVFVDGKITKHFEELQRVIGYVADVNKKISEAIDSITKGLTDALLATVGVLVLTVLAALVKKDTSIEIFKISMAIYSVYLVFYTIYRMLSIGHSYNLLSNEARTQLDEYEVALGAEAVTDISLPLKRRRNQFHIWFWVTIALYVLLAASIWWAGKYGPQLLIDRGIITAPAAKAAPSP